MQISGGITIGPGITIKSTGSTIRSALSAAGQAAYDAAYAGDFFRVSSTDYNSVKTSLANTKTIGDNSDAILYTGGSYSGTCAALNTPANSNVDPGFFIVGFVARHTSTSGANFRYLISASARGTYIQLANQVPVTNVSSSPSYYVRKDPTDANVSTQYVGIVSNTGTMIQSNTSWSNGAFSCLASNIASYPGPWTTRATTQPVFQTLLCGTQQW